MTIFKASYSRLDNIKDYYQEENEDIETDPKTANYDKYREAMGLLLKLTAIAKEWLSDIEATFDADTYEVLIKLTAKYISITSLDIMDISEYLPIIDTLLIESSMCVDQFIITVKVLCTD